VGNISAIHLKKNIDREDLLKEWEVSYVSSACSAPAVSQASVVAANRVDSCTVYATDVGCIENILRDEGVKN